MVHRGQIWEFKDTGRFPRNYRVFVCGAEGNIDGDWVWYLHLLDHCNIDGERRHWNKARVSDFEKKYTFTNHAVASRGYWKKKATGDIIQVIGVRDDGWKNVQVFYDLNKIDIHYFLEFFEPASKEETFAAIAREKHISKNMKKMKRRITMEKGDPNAAVTYE